MKNSLLNPGTSRVMPVAIRTLIALQLGLFLSRAALDLDPVQVGKWPPSVTGPADSVFVQGHYAYCTVTSETVPGLIIFDVINSSNPVPVGFYESGGLDPSDVFVVGTRAYLMVADRLVILDVSNPAEPRQTGQLPALGFVPGPRGLFVAGNYAYFAGGTLKIIDVSDSTQPRLAGTFSAGIGSFRDVAVSGDYAYVAEWAGGNGRLRVFDVRNPTNAVQVGSMSQIGPANAVCAFGSYAYVVTSQRNLHVVDVSNPAAPLRIGNYVDVGSAAVAVSGNHVYVGERYTGVSTSGGLRVMDVSNPTNPQLAGDYHAAGFTQGLSVSGTHAFLASGEGGLRIVDVNNPARPQGVGGYDTFPFRGVLDMFVANRKAYLAAADAGLQVFDVSQPANPLRLGKLFTGGQANGVAVSGNYAYLTEQKLWDGTSLVGGGLHVIDVSNPVNPQQVFSLGSGSDFGRVFTSGNYVYVEVLNEGLRVIDVSNPANPQTRGNYAATSVCLVSGGYAYVTGVTGAVDVVEIVDVSNPDNPTRVGIHVPAVGVWGMKIVLSGNLAYLAAPGNDVELLDVSNPANPVQVSRYNSKPGIVIGTGLGVSGDRAYVGHDWGVNELGFDVVDVSDPANPRKIGDYYDDASKLYAFGNDAYRTRTDFRVVDVRRLANPQRIGGYADFGGSIHRGGVVVTGSRAFLADGTNGLQVLDVSNPASPQRIGGYDTSGSAEDVFVFGNLAFVADWEAGLKIFDVSNPSSPQPLGSITLPDTVLGWSEVAERVVVSGNIAYVTGFELHVIDVSNPAQPVRLGGAQPPSGNLGLFVSGQYVYLVADGLHVYDVSNPANPQRVGGVDTGLDSYDVFVSGNFAYVANEDTGLHVIDVSNPSNPHRVGGYFLNYAWSVVVSNNYAYVMSRNSGLNVLDVSNPAQPRRVGGNTAVGGIVNYGGAADLAAVGGKLYVLAGGRGLFVLNLYQALRMEALPMQAPGAFHFLLHGPSGFSGRIQRSDNLRDWTDWQPFNLDSTPLQFTDADAGAGRQFYRAVSP